VGSTVLLVTPPSASPRLSGTSVLARCLAAHGEEFHYRMLSHPDAPALEGPVSLDPIYSGGGLARTLRMLGRVVTGSGCALHHYFFAPHPRAITVVRGASMFARRPTVHTVPSAPAAHLNPASLLFADRTVVMSEATALLFASAGAPTPTVIRPGTPLPDRPLPRAEARARVASSSPGLGWGDGPVFLYPGDASFSDGALTFVEAAGELASVYPEARFALACRAKTPRGAEVLAQVHRRAAALGLSGRLDTLGVVSDMEALLAAVDAVVLSVDTLYAKIDVPLVLLEAMAQGTPAIVSDLPSLAELPVLGDGAISVPRSDPKALAGAMGGLLADPDHLAAMGRAAREMVAHHFDAREMSAHYERLYEEVLHA
jgi:glycosyltransferase involved in cell wall biosynthesis